MVLGVVGGAGGELLDRGTRDALALRMEGKLITLPAYCASQ